MSKTVSHISAEIFARLWGIKESDYSLFSINAIRNEFQLPRAALDRLVLKRLKTIILFAEQNCSYYSKMFIENGIHARDIKKVNDIKEIPMLTRDKLRKNINGLLAGGEIDSSWISSATGGTTSSPVAFYCDKLAYSQKNLATLILNEWYGRRIGDKVAYLWGAPQDFSNSISLGERLRNLTYFKRLMLPSAPLNEEVLASHCRKLVDWQPTFLQAYPSPLFELCIFAENKGIDLSFIKSISVTAEGLNPHHRKKIEEVIGAEVYNWYGSRELARVASECECHDGLHINEPSVFVEIRPDKELPVDCGYLVVTDLRNRATPLIRYQTGDIARKVEGQCACGRILKRIASIEGRMVDMIVLPNGKKFPGVSLTNRIVKSYHEIKELQVVQKQYTSFLLRYVEGPMFNEYSLRSLKESLCDLLDEQIDVSFEKVVELPRESSGKVRFVINEL